MFVVCADAHGHRLYAAPSGRAADPWELDVRERAHLFKSEADADVVALRIGAQGIVARVVPNHSQLDVRDARGRA